MALVKFGVTVVGVRGTVGGGTFSANKAGPYLKSWARSSNPRSELQTDHRNILGKWATLWQSITAAQRTAWDVYAADVLQELTNSLGEPYYASGFNWYVKMNTALEEAGGGPISAAPVLAIPAAPTVTSFTFRSTANALNSTIRTNVADPNLAMTKAGFLAITTSGARTVPAVRAKLLAIKTPLIGGGSNGLWIFQTEMEARFGTVFADTRGFFYLYNQNSEGRRSSPWTGTMLFSDSA